MRDKPTADDVGNVGIGDAPRIAKPGDGAGDGAGASDRSSPWHVRWRPILGPVAVAAAAKVALLLITWLVLDRPDWFWAKLATAWDGEHYLRIARDGYQFRFQGDGDSVHWAFLYPAFIQLLGGSNAAALIINNLASLGAVAVVAWHFGSRPAMFLALFPSFLVFGSVAYSEGLFLLLGALALAWLERQYHIRGGIAASLAVMVRYMGGPFFILAAIPWRRPRTWSSAWSLGILAVTGTALWLFLWHWTGYFMGYYEAQRPWGGGLTTPWGHFDWLLHGWFTTQGGTVAQGNLGPVDFVVRDVLFLVPAIWGLVLLWPRRNGTGTFAYSLGVVLLALCLDGTPAAALPRYMLAAFPAIAILGNKLHSWEAWATYAATGLFLGVHGLAHHVAGYWS